MILVHKEYYSTENIKTKCLYGENIKIDGLGILYAKKINDIRELNKFEPDTYEKFISTLSITSYKIYELLGMDDRFENIHPFDFIYINCLNNEGFKDTVVKALSFFFDANVVFSINELFFINNKDGTIGTLSKNNFSFMTDIFKIQNCIPLTDDKKPKPKTEAQRQFFIKLNEQRIKHQSKHDVLNDIISSVSAKHPSINFFNIGNLTMYQLIDQYKRLNAIDEFYISIKSLLAGASKDEVKVRHWGEKLLDS